MIGLYLKLSTYLNIHIPGVGEHMTIVPSTFERLNQSEISFRLRTKFFEKSLPPTRIQDIRHITLTNPP